MSLKAMYNNIATRYDTANRFGSISQSHKCAIQQIKLEQINYAQDYNVLDLGVGDGLFLKSLQAVIPINSHCTGIDISKDMLTCAAKNLKLTTIETSALKASSVLPHHSQDLVLAHFINAYIPINTLIKEASLLTKANGYFSLITTTYDSFPAAQNQLASFIAKSSLLSSIVGHYYKAVVKNTTVAASEDDLLDTFKTNGLEIVAHQRLHIPIVFNNINDLAMFGIEGTWFLNSLAIKMLPKNFLIQRLKRMFHKIFTFPYQDTHIIDVILARK